MTAKFAFLLLLGVAEMNVFVLSPDSLKQRYLSGVPVKFATFGQIPFGSYVAGVVLPTNSDCCSANCSATGFNSTFPFIFLIPNSTCSANAQVYYAERAGAKAVLLRNTMARQDGGFLSSPERYVTSIPSMLLYFLDGERFLQESKLAVNITFESTNLQATVNVQALFAMVPSSDSQFAGALSAISSFGGILSLNLYFSLLSCPSCGSNDQRCICQNRYCSSVNGHVVREAIRQQCVFNLTATGNDYTAYVSYMLNWAEKCYYPSKACSSAFIAAGVDATKVEKCYLSSFVGGSEYASDNYFLASALNATKTINSEFTPSFIVNGDVVYGSQNSSILHRAICAHLNFRYSSCAEYFCAPGCWPEMKKNFLCDTACNVQACMFDNGDCNRPISLVSPNNHSDIQTNSSNPAVPTDHSSTNDSTEGVPSSSWSPYLISGNVPADCQCSIFEIQSPICFPKCNNVECFYQNWTCPCAPQCTREMLLDEQCDSACNTYACKQDFQSCFSMQSFSNATIIKNNVASGFWDEAWRLPAILACGVFLVLMYDSHRALLVIGFVVYRTSRSPLPIVRNCADSNISINLSK